MQNPENFAVLDTLLDRLERPLHPALDDRGVPPYCLFDEHGPLEQCDVCEEAWEHNCGRWPPPCDDHHGPDEYCEKCHAKVVDPNVDHAEEIRSELTELMEGGVEDNEDDEEDEEEDAEEEEEDEEEDVF